SFSIRINCMNMKNILYKTLGVLALTLIICGASFGQEKRTDTLVVLRSLELGEIKLSDTVIMENMRTGERKKVQLLTPPDRGARPRVKITIGSDGEDSRSDTIRIGKKDKEEKSSDGKAIFGITLSRLDWGFSR